MSELKRDLGNTFSWLGQEYISNSFEILIGIAGLWNSALWFLFLVPNFIEMMMQQKMITDREKTGKLVIPKWKIIFSKLNVYNYLVARLEK